MHVPIVTLEIPRLRFFHTIELQTSFRLSHFRDSLSFETRFLVRLAFTLPRLAFTLSRLAFPSSHYRDSLSIQTRFHTFETGFLLRLASYSDSLSHFRDSLSFQKTTVKITITCQFGNSNLKGREDSLSFETGFLEHPPLHLPAVALCVYTLGHSLSLSRTRTRTIGVHTYTHT